MRPIPRMPNRSLLRFMLMPPMAGSSSRPPLLRCPPHGRNEFCYSCLSLLFSAAPRLRAKKKFSRILLALVRVWNHIVADHGVQLGAGRQELAQRSGRGPERIEIVDRDAVFGVSPAEIGELIRQCPDNLRVHRMVHSWNGLDIARVIAKLPGIRRGNHHVSADEQIGRASRTLRLYFS